MPQMAPLNWLMLFITVITIMLAISATNYFSFMQPPSTKNFINKISTNWKW